MPTLKKTILLGMNVVSLIHNASQGEYPGSDREGGARYEREEAWTRSRMCVCMQARGIETVWKRVCGRERQPVWVLCLLRRSSEIYRRRRAISGHRQAFASRSAGAGLAATSTTSESLESYVLDTEIPAAARRPRSTRGSQKWSNVRAVMALYSSLRKIKRYSRH